MAKIDEHVKVMMLKGETGANIKSIDKTATSGLVDTYTVTLTDGSKSNFTVTNGRDGKDGADFDTFEIGGRNLARNSANLDITPDKGNLCVGKYEEGVIEDRGDGFKAVRIYNPYRGIGVYVNSLGLNPGDRLVFSAVYEPSGSDSKAAFFAIGSDSSGKLVHNFLYVNSSTVLGDSAILGNVEDGDSKRLSVYIKWTDEAKRLIDSGGSIELTIEAVDGVGSGNSASIYAPKLERSTKPSDWTPAPEDKADVSTIVRTELVESTAMASHAYADGDYMVVNGLLRRATAAIAEGDAISDGNSTDTTVSAEIKKLARVVGETDTWHELYSSEDWSVYYTERHSVLYVRAHVGKLGTSWWKAGTLPFGYRPQMDFYAPVYNYSENACAGIFVGKNGDVSMQSYQAQSATISWSIVTIPLW